ncbi:unnamed protein product [Diamesa tonsa]
MDILLNADLRAKEIEKLFINYSIALMKAGYIGLLEDKKYDHLDDIADIFHMTRQLGKIYTGIDLAPDMSLNLKVNTVMNDLLANSHKSTPNDFQQEFRYEKERGQHLRNTTNAYQERREEQIKQLIRETERRDLTNTGSSISNITAQSDNTRTQREHQLDELSRVVEGRLETLNQMSNSLSPRQQLAGLNEMSATRSNISNSSSVLSSPEGLSNLVSNQIIQHLSNISQKLDERHSSNFQQLSQNIKSLIQKLNEQQVVINRMSHQHDVMSQILERIPVQSGLTVPNNSSVGAYIPNASSDTFLSSNQFAQNVPLS